MNGLQKTWATASLVLACLWTITPDARAIGGQFGPGEEDPCHFNSSLNVSCNLFDNGPDCPSESRDHVPTMNDTFPPSFMPEDEEGNPPPSPWCDGCNTTRPKWVQVHCGDD